MLAAPKKWIQLKSRGELSSMRMHFLQDLRFGYFFVISYPSKCADIIVIYKKLSLREQIRMLPLLLDNFSKSLRKRLLSCVKVVATIQSCQLEGSSDRYASYCQVMKPLL